MQPRTHKIKSASARSSHRCPLPCPLLPLHSMLKVAKLFPFVGGAIKHKFISTTLIPGVIGDYILHLVCYFFVHTYCSRVAKFLPPTVPALRPSLCSIPARSLPCPFWVGPGRNPFLCPGLFWGSGLQSFPLPWPFWGEGGSRGYKGLSFTVGLLNLRTDILFKSCNSSSHRARSTSVSLLYTCSAPAFCCGRHLRPYRSHPWIIRKAFAPTATLAERLGAPGEGRKHAHRSLAGVVQDHPREARSALWHMPREACYLQWLPEPVRAQAPEKHCALRRRTPAPVRISLITDRLEVLLFACHKDGSGAMVQKMAGVLGPVLRTVHRERLPLKPQKLGRQRENLGVKRPLAMSAQLLPSTRHFFKRRLSSSAMWV